jgi:polyisoprenyl-phosphate glycosyltransferase
MGLPKSSAQLAAKSQPRLPKKDAAEVPTYSIVVPVFNEREVLGATYRELCATLERLDDTYEVIFVDDGSRDGSRDILIALSEKDPAVLVVSLARNFGHEIATTVGMHKARGRAVIVIDADLQDPPELILEMARRWKEGFEVVYGVRTQREGESWIKRITAYCFYRLMAGIADFPFPADAGDFRLMDKRVVDIYRGLDEDPRFFRGLISWIGFRQTGLSFRRRPRAAGKSKYRYTRLVRLAFDTITAFSSFPAQLILALSMLGIGLSGAAGFVSLTGALVGAWKLETTFWMVAAGLVLLNFQLVATALLAQYIVRTHRNTQGRPLYIVDSVYRGGNKE